ncbi:MAG: hypothetical protein KAV87_55920 [Desulfobacteraceae bacterium]|nr:hypothetical protein [Desulfobacteraceae bacterium]
MNTSRLLNEVFNEFLKEVRANPDLSGRLGKIIEKHKSGTWKPSGRPYRRRPGAFDPMVVYRENPDKLRPQLEELSIEELKDIIAEHGMDRSKLAMKWKTKDRLIALIVTTVESRMHKGDAFRSTASKQD